MVLEVNHQYQMLRQGILKLLPCHLAFCFRIKRQDSRYNADYVKDIEPDNTQLWWDLGLRKRPGHGLKEIYVLDSLFQGMDFLKF